MADDRTPEQRAYAQGVEAATLKADVEGQERRLNRINSSIDRTADELSKMHRMLDDLCGDLKTRVKVEEATKDLVTAAAAKQVTTRQFFFAIAALFTALVGLYFGAQG